MSTVKHAKWYQAWSKNFPDYRLMTPNELKMAINRNYRWIRSKIKQGYKIYDIGIDPTKATRSPFYEVEKNTIDKLKYPTSKLPE